MQEIVQVKEEEVDELDSDWKSKESPSPQTVVYHKRNFSHNLIGELASHENFLASLEPTRKEHSSPKEDVPDSPVNV